MKKLLFRATAPAVSLASCLVMFGGVASAQTISDSGRDSHNTISSKNICVTDVHNNTHINLSNSNWQDAQSGDAKVMNNDDVGSVSTGSASNSNTTSFTLGVTNTTAGCGATVEQPGGGQGGGQTGGQGGGQVGGMGGGGEVVTPAATTPTPTAGGQGGGTAAAPVAHQVAVVPTGGVGAGEGTPVYLAGLLSVTLASGALGIRRLRNNMGIRF